MDMMDSEGRSTLVQSSLSSKEDVISRRRLELLGRDFERDSRCELCFECRRRSPVRVVTGEEDRVLKGKGAFVTLNLSG